MVCDHESGGLSEPHRKQVAHRMREGRPVHEIVRFRGWEVVLGLSSIKRPVFLAGKVFSRSTAKISGVFLAGRWQTKKRHPERMSP